MLSGALPRHHILHLHPSEDALLPLQHRVSLSYDVRLNTIRQVAASLAPTLINWRPRYVNVEDFCFLRKLSDNATTQNAIKVDVG